MRATALCVCVSLLSIFFLVASLLSSSVSTVWFCRAQREQHKALSSSVYQRILNPTFQCTKQNWCFSICPITPNTHWQLENLPVKRRSNTYWRGEERWRFPISLTFVHLYFSTICNFIDCSDEIKRARANDFSAFELLNFTFGTAIVEASVKTIQSRLLECQNKHVTFSVAKTFHCYCCRSSPVVWLNCQMNYNPIAFAFRHAFVSSQIIKLISDKFVEKSANFYREIKIDGLKDGWPKATNYRCLFGGCEALTRNHRQ